MGYIGLIFTLFRTPILISGTILRYTGKGAWAADAGQLLDLITGAIVDRCDSEERSRVAKSDCSTRSLSAPTSRRTGLRYVGGGRRGGWRMGLFCCSGYCREKQGGHCPWLCWVQHHQGLCQFHLDWTAPVTRARIELNWVSIVRICGDRDSHHGRRQL